MTRRDVQARWVGVLLIAACGGEVQVVGESGRSGAGGDPTSRGGYVVQEATAGAGGDLGPRSCSLVQGDIDLIPSKDSPLDECSPITCTVWFGHGQHLDCPGWNHDGAWTAACSIWDCHCVDDETGAFFADFSTGMVVDERKAGVVCRYTMVPREN